MRQPQLSQYKDIRITPPGGDCKVRPYTHPPGPCLTPPTTHSDNWLVLQRKRS